MPVGKMNMFGNQQAMPPQNQNFQQPLFQQPVGSGYGGGSYTPTLLRGMQKLMPVAGGQGGFLKPPGLGQFFGMQNAGGQGFAAPGYPPQNYGAQMPQQPIPQQSMPQQPIPQQPMSPLQGYPSQINPSQGYPYQGYAAQGYSQGYGGQMPVQPAWEEPKKGGIKGFISNLMAKRKR